MKVAKTNWQFVLVIWMSVASNAMFAQTATTVNMNTSITIDRSESTFESLLNVISKQSGVVFSFSSKKIASNKVLKIPTGRQTLGEVLQQINVATGLQHKVVGTHIIFLDKNVSASKSAPPANARSTVISKSSQPVSPLKSKISHQGKRDTLNGTSIASLKPDSIEVAVQPQLRSTAVADSQASTLKASEEKDPIIKRDDSLKIAKRDSTIDSAGRGKKTALVDSTTSMTSGADSASRVRQNTNEYVESKISWLFGAQVSRTGGVENKSESMNTTGIGLHIKIERAFTRRFSYTFGIEYDYFTGSYRYNLFSGSSADTTIRNFAIAPVLAGIKYQFSNRFYLSAEMGPALKASSEVRTKLALAPSAGVTFPTKKAGFDLSLRYVYIVRGYGTLESNSLKNGGYSFLSLKAAYRINNGRFGRKGPISGGPTRYPSQAALRSLRKIDVSGHGIAFSIEPRVGDRTMLDLSLGVGGGYEITDRVRYTWDINNPAVHLSITPKFYYNRSQRVQSGKLSYLNSGNYLGLRIKYVTRGIGSDASIYDTFLMNLHWGLQRAIATRWSFGAHAGAGYAVDVTDMSNPYECFYPSFDVKFSYILSALKK